MAKERRKLKGERVQRALAQLSKEYHRIAVNVIMGGMSAAAYGRWVNQSRQNITEKRKRIEQKLKELLGPQPWAEQTSSEDVSSVA